MATNLRSHNREAIGSQKDNDARERAVSIEPTSGEIVRKSREHCRLPKLIKAQNALSILSV
jgi:hypothetical protein